MSTVPGISKHKHSKGFTRREKSYHCRASNNSAKPTKDSQHIHPQAQHLHRRMFKQYSAGNIVEPGRVLNRAERERIRHMRYQDNDSSGSEDSLVCPEQTFTNNLLQELSDLTGVDLTSLHMAKARIHCADTIPLLRHYILVTIFFLLIFGSLHVVISHLLYASRSNAQCSPLVSYVPVTFTVTQYVTPTISIHSAEESTAIVPHTITSTRTLTVELSQVTSDPTNTYSYVTESGTTKWIGATPSSGQQLVTLTTTVFVYPPGPATSTLDTVTVSPPPYVTTTYNAPDSDTTITMTTTQMETTTVSNIVTLTRSAFSFGSAGWNSTLSGATSFQGVPTAITGTVYWSTGSKITSTGLTTMTLTITQSHDSVITILPITSSHVESASLSTQLSSSDGHLSSMQSSSQVSAPDYTSGSTLMSISSSLSSAFSDPTETSLQSYAIVPASYDGSSQSQQPSTAMTSVDSTSTSSKAGSLSTYPASLVASSTGTAVAAQSSSKALASSYSVDPSVERSSMTTGSSGLSKTSGSMGTMSSSSVSLSVRSGVSSSGTQSYSNMTVSTRTSLPASNASSYTPVSSTAVLSSTSPGSISTSVVPISSSTMTTASTPLNATASAYFSSTDPTTASSSMSTNAVSSSGSVTSTAHANTSSALAQYSIPTMSSSSISISAAPLSSITASSTISANGTTLVSSPAAAVSSSTSVSSSSSATSLQTRSESSNSASNTVSSASSTPSVCGEHGDFMLNFDDLPSFSTNNNNTDITQAPPIFNGYHHFAFSNGYVYAPPPNDPFSPVSPPHLAVFLGNASGSGLNNTPTAMAPTSGTIRPGEFGDGDSDAVSAFWFNAYSAWLGCDNPGPSPCTYVVTAYAWDPAAEKEQQMATETVTTSACPGFKDCHLEKVSFPSSFTGLSGLQIQAYRGPDQVMFFMDDVSMGWYNNTCAAGLQRLRSQRGGTPPMKRMHRFARL